MRRLGCGPGVKTWTHRGCITKQCELGITGPLFKLFSVIAKNNYCNTIPFCASTNLSNVSNIFTALLSNFKLLLLMVVIMICILFYNKKAAMLYEGIMYENNRKLFSSIDGLMGLLPIYLLKSLTNISAYNILRYIVYNDYKVHM